jgi:O-antigen/teichoic acid export membrane protein
VSVKTERERSLQVSIPSSARRRTSCRRIAYLRRTAAGQHRGGPDPLRQPRLTARICLEETGKLRGGPPPDRYWLSGRPHTTHCASEPSSGCKGNDAVSPADGPNGKAESRTPTPGLGELAARNARTLVLLAGLQRVVSLVTIVALPRLLTVADYGLLGSALAVAAVLGVLSDTGMQLATSRHLAEAVERGEDGSSIVGGALILRSTLGMVGVVIGIVILTLGPFPSTVRWGGMLGLAATVNPVWSIYGSVLQAHFDIGKLRTLTVTSAAASSIISVIIALVHGGVLGILGAQAAIPWLLSPLVVRAGSRYIHPRLRGSRRWMRTLLGTAWQVGASTLLVSVYYRLDTVLLTAWSTSVQVALYFSAYRLTEASAILPFAVVPAFFPAIARLRVSSPAAALAMAWRVTRVLSSAGLIVANVGILNAALAVRTLYGGRYDGAVSSVQILFLAVPLMYFNFSALQTTVAFGRPRVLLAGTFVGFVVNVAANLLLIPRLGGEGASIATVLTEAAVAVVAVRWLLPRLEPNLPLAVGRTLITGSLLVAAIPASRTLGGTFSIVVTGPWVMVTIAASGLLDRPLAARVWKSRPRLGPRWG